MKSRTLFVMLGLVGLAALALVLTDGDDEATIAPNPLRAVDFASLDRIAAARKDGEDWVLERVGDRWRLSSSVVADGSPVPASREITEKLIGALRDCEPQSRVDIDNETLGSYELAPPRLSLTLRDANGETRLDVGQPRIDNFVGFRAEGGTTGFRVHLSIFDDFARHPSWYRDPRLLNIRFAELEELRLIDDAGTRRLRREAGQWLVTGVDGGVLPGDANLCDRFAAGVLALAGPPVAPDDPRLKTHREERHVEFVARSRDGRESRGTIHLVDEARQQVLMSRPDDPTLRVAGRIAWRLLSRDFSELRSLRLLQVNRSELSEIRVARAGQDELRLQQKTRGAWYLLTPGTASDPKVDQERFDAFTDRLLNLRVLAGMSTTDSQELGETRWTVTLGFPADTASPPIVLSIAAPGDDGSARAKRSDRAELVSLEPVDLSFLDRGWWHYAQRFVTSFNEGDVTEIKLQDAKEPDEGTLHVIKGTDANDEDQWLTGERPVAADFIRPLLGRISFLAVEEFIGPLSAHPRFRDVTPRFVVSWRLPVVDTVRVDWMTWRVLARYDDERWACTIDHFPDMLFLIRGEDLLVVENALRGIRKS